MADVQTQSTAAPADPKNNYVADAKAANTKYNTAENREKAKKGLAIWKKFSKFLKF